MIRFLTAALMLLAPVTAYAEDLPEDSVALMRAFENICVQNLNHIPGAVYTWAEKNSVPPVSDQGLLDLFVGEGAKDGAWILPMPKPHSPIAVSIDIKFAICSVWAQHTDVAPVIQKFGEYVEGLAKGGFKVNRLPDKAQPGNFLRSITYDAVGKDATYRFVLSTAADDKGPYQVHLWAMPLSPTK